MQMLSLRGTPSVYMVVFWMLANHRVRVWRLEWLTLLPDCPALLQISHLAIELPLTVLTRFSRIV